MNVTSLSRSTMAAWEDIQLDLAKKLEGKDLTGVLLWDLSAAFDTLDSEIFCKKIELYGFEPKTVDWFISFLTGRCQRVKIGSAISSLANLSSGVPQGGVISPLIFVLYVLDLELWLKWSSAKTYADDQTTTTTAKSVEELVKRIEEDAIIFGSSIPLYTRYLCTEISAFDTL